MSGPREQVSPAPAPSPAEGLPAVPGSGAGLHLLPEGQDPDSCIVLPEIALSR